MARLRITYTAGPAPLGSGRGDATPTLIVVADGWPRGRPRRGGHGAVAAQRAGALAGLKTTSYAENVVALAEAKRRGATEAIFGNLAGHLCEGTGSNVFYVVDGELRTPTLAAAASPG